jgi:hypothetical protein
MTDYRVTQRIDGKWIVVKNDGHISGLTVWSRVSPEFNTSYQAREFMTGLLFGRNSEVVTWHA